MWIRILGVFSRLLSRTTRYFLVDSSLFFIKVYYLVYHSRIHYVSNSSSSSSLRLANEFLKSTRKDSSRSYSGTRLLETLRPTTDVWQFYSAFSTRRKEKSVGVRSGASIFINRLPTETERDHLAQAVDKTSKKCLFRSPVAINSNAKRRTVITRNYLS